MFYNFLDFLEYKFRAWVGNFNKKSFSPLKSELHNLPCLSPKQKCALSYTILFYTMYT